jgi:hypothetical protein
MAGKMRSPILRFSAVALALLGASTAFAQDRTPEPKRKPPNISCEAFAGESRKQCLRDERIARSDERRLEGTCDDLLGPEKERCLKQGGTIEAGASQGAQERSSTGR